jgi:hypothetical protein
MVEASAGAATLAAKPPQQINSKSILSVPLIASRHCCPACAAVSTVLLYRRHCACRLAGWAVLLSSMMHAPMQTPLLWWQPHAPHSTIIIITLHQ